MQKESEAKEKEQQQAARALQQIEAVSSQMRIFPIITMLLFNIHWWYAYSYLT
jgi:hypothetical protein